MHKRKKVGAVVVFFLILFSRYAYRKEKKNTQREISIREKRKLKEPINRPSSYPRASVTIFRVCVIINTPQKRPVGRLMSFGAN